jgi:hypothetical protein
VCRTALHHVEQCLVKGHHILFCSLLDDPHCKCFASLNGLFDMVMLCIRMG